MKFAYACGSRPLDGYVIKRGIGAGGFGDVYYATSDAGKEVALKRIQRNLDVELRGVSQCLNLKHPNLVALYDIRYDDTEQAWVVMEYVSGDSLQEVIEQNPQGLSDEQVEFWIGGIMQGVAYLHDHGIVHRDLKPGNIFLDQDTVKIGDYGLSKFISCSRRSGQTESVGTFHYMAPEIGLGRYGKEIDIYALGILLYEMLTGHVPFEGESSQEIIMKHLTAQPDLARVPERYRTTIARALAKDPADRFDSVAAMQATMTTRQTAPHAAPHGGGSAARFAKPPWLNGVGPVGIGAVGMGAARVGGQYAAAAQAKIHRALQRGGVPPRSFADTLPGNHAVGAPMANTRKVEPIAAAVRMQAQKFRDWWRSLPPWKRVLVAVASLYLFVVNASWLIGVLFGTGVAYGGYYVMWSLFGGGAATAPPPLPIHSPPNADQPYHANDIGNSPEPYGAVPADAPGVQPIMAAVVPPTPSRPIPRSGPPRPRQLTRQQINDRMREALGQKSFVRRGSELTGSMLLAAIAVMIVSVLMTIAGVQNQGRDLQQWAPLYVWIAVTGTSASWSILGLGKLWEGSPPDPALRRFMLLIAGMFIGCLAWALADALMLDPAYNFGPIRHHRDGLGGHLPALYAPDGAPRILAYAGYFGAVFLSLRWWIATDPLRNSRFSLWGVVVTGVFGVLWYLVIPIPRALMVILTTIIASQLAATWVPQQKRDRFKERLFAEERMAGLQQR
jgi:hypothetical protein